MNSAGLFLLSLLVVVPFAFPVPKRPHVVMFVMDDVGFSDTSLYNATNDISTPFLERAARQGILLDRYYAPPVCSPSRASMMQGRWAWKSGMQHYCTIAPASTAAMNDAPTLAESMKAAGYATAAIGKWHLGYAHWKNTPMARGFDFHKGYFQGEIDYYNKTFKIPSRFLPVVNVTGFDWWEGKTVLRNETGLYNPDILDTTMEQVIEQHPASAKPLFLYYAHQLAHVPLETPPPFNISSACTSIVDPLRRTYCTMMQILDSSLGRLEAALRAKPGMWENTLVVVVSDNGGMPNVPGGFPDSAGCNFPLRGGKGTPFEGGVRVPALMMGGVIPESLQGTKTSVMVTAVDWFPTFLAAAGAANHTDEGDGEDVWSLVVNGQQPRNQWIPLNVNLNVDFPNSGLQVALLSRNGFKLALVNISGPVLNYDGWFPVPPQPIQPPPPTSSQKGAFLFNVLQDPYELDNLFDVNVTQRDFMMTYLDNVLKPLYVAPQHNRPHLVGFPEFHHGVWAPFLPILGANKIGGI